jgi:hypothetical protein
MLTNKIMPQKGKGPSFSSHRRVTPAPQEKPEEKATFVAFTTQSEPRNILIQTGILAHHPTDPKNYSELLQSVRNSKASAKKAKNNELQKVYGTLEKMIKETPSKLKNNI